jgi:hypothetical protein
MVLFPLFSSLSYGIEEDIDSEYCSPQYYQCTDAQRLVVARFWQGSQPSILSSESVYSGECTMVSQSYDPAHLHHGYIDLRKQGQHFGFHGEFAYFYEENPYSKLTVADAVKKDPQDSPYFLQFRPQDVRIITSESAQWQYFIRQVAPNQLVMIGQQGIYDSIICDLHLNDAVH